jgi:hypothetical protein
MSVCPCNNTLGLFSYPFVAGIVKKILCTLSSYGLYPNLVISFLRKAGNLVKQKDGCGTAHHFEKYFQ